MFFFDSIISRLQKSIRLVWFYLFLRCPVGELPFSIVAPILFTGMFAYPAYCSPALLKEAEKGNAATVAVLLKNGASVNYQDSHGLTALIHASAYGHIHVMRILLEHGASINVQSNRGISALHAAAEMNQLEAVKLLIDKKADKSLTTFLGMRAADIARKKENWEMLKVIEPENWKSYQLPEESALVIARLFDKDDVPDPGVNCIFTDIEKGSMVQARTDTTGSFEVILPKKSVHKVSCEKFGKFLKFEETLILENPSGPYTYHLKLKIIVNTAYTQIINLEHVLFEVNKSDIRETSAKALEFAVNLMKQYPDIIVEIAGHTDATGTKEKNMNLSRDRAESVRQYLIGRGIAQTRIIAKGYGPIHPVASNKTAEGRKKNRRTELRIIKVLQ